MQYVFDASQAMEKVRLKKNTIQLKCGVLTFVSSSKYFQIILEIRSPPRRTIGHVNRTPMRALHDCLWKSLSAPDHKMITFPEAPLVDF